jgi:hypothetical protein
MKKPGLIVIVLSAVLAILSCDPKYYTVTVKNQSGKDVAYTYNGIKTDDLAPGDFREYQVEAYTPPPGEISVEGAMSVEMESLGSGERYVFKNRKSLVLQVTNKLSEDVYLTADKYIDASASTPPSPPPSSLPTTTLYVPKNNITNTATIYTENPRFVVLATLSSLFYPPPVVRLEIKNNVMEVVITDQ